MAEDVSSASKIFAGVLRAHRQKTEFSATDVLAHAPDGPAKSTVSNRLDDLEDLGVVESRSDPDDGRRVIWSLILDPEQSEIPVEERFVND